MTQLKQMVSHPYGRVGITVGLGLGLVAALAGETSKGLFFAGLCRFLASRAPR
ncbi:MAG TPA: hypothetical protein VFN23_14850 [Ktedonobacteraceae bacterium]|jgi:hypothetical protein|nr:hypothetical protein [Ktedonobacteraceae bacterium]